MITWTRCEWVKWWQGSDPKLRDFLWGIMVDTHRRLAAEESEKAE